MFNLIMLSGEWGSGRKSAPLSRMLEYTAPHLISRFRPASGLPDFDALDQLPCLFMEEGTGDEVARVGRINRARISGSEVYFEYSFDLEVPALTNEVIYSNRNFLDMPNDFEFSRNHWAVKDVDLYQFLLRNTRPRRQRPVVFEIPEHERIEPNLASAMMPFDASFNRVYEAIRQAATNVGMNCRRADDIWEHAAIIQDVVSLIDRSRIVVCDCTGKNANVFYEAGIAHTLGRNVILITQNQADIPFDLRHLRYIPYLNNGEGLAQLANALEERMRTLIGN